MSCESEAGVSPSRLRIHKEALSKAYTVCPACEEYVDLTLQFEDGSVRHLSPARFQGMSVRVIELMKKNIVPSDCDAIIEKPKDKSDAAMRATAGIRQNRQEQRKKK